MTTKIGILGGTFDPVHNAHIALAHAAFRQLKLNKVALVLSPQSPFKLKDDLTPAPARLAMLRRAIKGKAGLVAATWEMKRRGPCYMVDTLAAYKKAHPSHQLFLILGSDALKGFPNWKKPDTIAKLATLVVGRRPGTGVDECLPGVTFLHGEFPAVSSTEIRARVAADPRQKIAVSPRVRSYILERKLYSPPHGR